MVWRIANAAGCRSYFTGCRSYLILKNSIFGRKKVHSAKLRPKKLCNSRKNEMSPFQKPRKRAFPSRSTGGKISARKRKCRKNKRFRDSEKAAMLWKSRGECIHLRPR